MTALPPDTDTDTDDDDDDDDDDILGLSIDDVDAPVKVQKHLRNAFGEPLRKSRKDTSGPGSTHMPDFAKMTSTGKSGRTQDTLNKPFDKGFQNLYLNQFYNLFGTAYIKTSIW